jgi:hypothetical protein
MQVADHNGAAIEVHITIELGRFKRLRTYVARRGKVEKQQPACVIP